MRFLGMTVMVLCAAAASFGAVSFDSATNTLTYGSPGDLGTQIDPPGLADVQASFGMEKAAFQALSPQVVGFNEAAQSFPGPGQNLKAVVVTFATGKTIKLNLPAAMYNYGGKTSNGRSAFSGTAAYCDFSTIETQPAVPGFTPPDPPGTWNAWLEINIDTAAAGGQGVSALGFCACSHNVVDFQSGPGSAFFLLSDGTAEKVDYPKFGGDDPTQKIFIGYQAPTGKTITGVICTRPSPGNSFIAIDDVSFVMTAPAHKPGDINNDGKVNVFDLQRLANSWNKQQGQTGYDAACDLTGDNKVNVFDLQIMAQNWNK